MRAVQIQQYGDESVLEIQELPDPQPGEGEVVVRVVTAGTNPGEAGIRSGAMAEMYPIPLPIGEGSDLAGHVVAVGPGVTGLAIGQPVIGLSDSRNAQAELALLPADRVVPKPDGLDWDVAATLYVAGTTALAALQTVPVGPGDTAGGAGAAGGGGGGGGGAAALPGPPRRRGGGRRGGVGGGRRDPPPPGVAARARRRTGD